MVPARRIERRLAKRHLRDGTLVLYDLTSVWMEGRACPLARRGHARDGKRGKLQIVFGMLCDRAGCPVAVEVSQMAQAKIRSLVARSGARQTGSRWRSPRW